VVVGGSGFYGRYLVDDVLRHTAADVVVASRTSTGGTRARHGRLRYAGVDHRDVSSLVRVFDGASVVVHCAGPFQDMPGRPMPLGPLRAALDTGVPYIDIAEDREFRRAVLAEAAESGSDPDLIFTGASVVPGLQAIALKEISRSLDSINEVRCTAAPDTRRHRGDGMFRALMHGLGTPFTAPRAGVLTPTYGWSEPEWVEFPPPIGRRLVYQVYEMADLDVVPSLCDAHTVTFKAGTEFALLNRALGQAAAVRARTGHPHRAEKLTTPARTLSWLLGRVGNDAGGFFIEVRGARAGRSTRQATAITADHHGGRIPSLLAGVIVADLLDGRLPHAPGPWGRWPTSRRVWSQFADRGINLWRREGNNSWARSNVTEDPPG
jgi:hypothetical protein